MRRTGVVALASSAEGTCCACLDRELSATGPVATAPGRGVAAAAALIDQVSYQAGRDGYDIAGVAVACADEVTSRNICAETAARFALPVATVPFAHAALEGERLRGAAAGRSSALLLDTQALGLGLLLNGSLYRGGAGRAGSAAHLGLDRTGTLRCRCGRTGCLAALLEAGEDAPAPPTPAEGRPAPSRRLGWLAVALVTLLNTVNPEVLILSGSPSPDTDEFAWLGRTARLGCLAPTRAGLVDVTRARRDTALVGAAALAFRGQPLLPLNKDDVMSTKMQAMIAEQPEALRRFLASPVDLAALQARVRDRAIRKVWILGSGTSLFAAMIAAAHWERHLPVDAEAISSLEFLESVPDRQLGPDTAVVGISQSGASFILVEGLRRARAAGAVAIGVTAEPGALIGEGAEFVVPTLTGPETAMGKTKGFTTTAFAACWLASRLGSQDREGAALAAFPAAVAQVIGEVEAEVERWVAQFVGAEALFAVGSGELVPAAWEGGLKVLEVAKQVLVTKELEEMLHGPFNAVGPTSAFLLLAGQIARRDRLDAFLNAVEALQLPLLAVTDARTSVAEAAGRMIYRLPALAEPALEAILAVVPLQIFADRLAAARGLDGDTTRYPHLYKILAAKSIYV